jgi:predicted dehydrogenase
VRLRRAELTFGETPVETAAALEILLDCAPFTLTVSWNAPRPLTEIAFEVEGEGGTLRWENVDGSFFRFRTLRDRTVLLDRETTLRADTLAAFGAALRSGAAPPVDVRVYELLAEAYGGS